MNTISRRGSLRVGYLEGAESFPLMMVADSAEEGVFGRRLELVEYVAQSSLRRALERGQLDYALLDSVEAFCLGSADLRTGLLIRGNEVRMVVSEKIARLGGSTSTGLTSLFHNRILNKPLRMGISEVGGTVELYLMELIRSVGRNWIEQIHLPESLMESSLCEGLLDGYLRINETGEREGRVLGEKNHSCLRREMALVVVHERLERYREEYLQLLAILLQAEALLKKGEGVEVIAALSGMEMGSILRQVTEVYAGKHSLVKDPGVLSKSMSGGLIAPSGQWGSVVRERLRRSSCDLELANSHFVVEGLFGEAMALTHR